LASPVYLKSGPVLRKALVDLYCAILAFLVNAKAYLGHSTAYRAITIVSKGNEFSARLKNVQKCEQTVRLNTNNADAEYMRAVRDLIKDVKSDLRNLLNSLPIPLTVIKKKINKLAKTTNKTH
jgi:hexokinase